MRFVDKFTFINAAREAAPVNVHLLCRALGIGLHEVPLPGHITGQIECSRGKRYVIKINSEDSDTRKRFTIAHALGHWVYHRPVMGAGICDSQAYTSIPSATFHNRRIGLKEEIQANKFAARLLMPEALIYAHQDKGVTDSAALADLFGVSEATMKIRLGAMSPR